MTAPEPGQPPVAGRRPTGDASADCDPRHGAAAAGESVEVVDVDGTVQRVATRAQMRSGRLRHRCTYIVVVDRQDRVVVHRRAAWKDVWPSRWDLAFGGVAGVGEAWETAATRELAEEAGVEAPLEVLIQDSYDDHEVSVLGRVYLARHDGPFTFSDGEVVASERIPGPDVLAWLKARSHCPDSVALVGDALAVHPW